jgi:hypothetical protein
MKKLRLDPHLLRVESFIPREDGALLRGTVQAQSHVSDMVPSGCCGDDKSMYCQPTDFAWNTCGASCEFQCHPSLDEPTCAEC